jgi:D-arginine dehydrogenase
MNDIIVIGGGIAGISAAARLSHHGSVTLLESEDDLAYHSSGRSAASFIVDYGNNSTRILNAASFDYLNNENNGVLSNRGLLMLATEKQNVRFKSSYKLSGLSQISLNDACKTIPIISRSKVSYAAYRSDVFDLDTNQLIQNFLTEAKRNGANIVKKSKVLQINYINSKWNIETDKNQFQCSIIVNAAGAWADQISILAHLKPVGFKPYRRSMARIKMPDSMSISDWPFFSGPNEDWYAKPDAGQLIVSPEEEELVEPHDVWADDTTIAKGIARYEKYVTVPVTNVTSNWAGLRTFSADRSLVIGPDQNNPTFFYLAGQGGYGFQTAPAASNLLKELILGQTNDLDKETVRNLSAFRFK